jgi:cytochrome c
MPSFEFNKIIAAVLTAFIVAQVAGLLAEQFVRPNELAKPVFIAAGPSAPEGAPAEAAAAAPALPPIAPLLVKADAQKGQQATTVCQVCHSFDKGGPNKIGPNLWNIVDQPAGEDRGGFSFSDALEKHKGQKWTPERLNEWLDDPQHYAPGTKMTFAGFPEAQKRADVIKYLETLK